MPTPSHTFQPTRSPSQSLECPRCGAHHPRCLDWLDTSESLNAFECSVCGNTWTAEASRQGIENRW
jgi:hypothetical protein